MSNIKILSRLKRLRKPETTITARVDGLVCDVLCGWAWDKANPAAPVELQVICGGKVVGESVADNFREDLQQAGIGNGEHAFSIALEHSFLSNPANTFHLVEKLSELRLSRKESRVGDLAGYGGSLNPATINSVDGRRATGWVYDPARPEYAPIIEILADGAVVGEGQASDPRPDLVAMGIANANHAFSIMLEPTLFDGEERQLSVKDRQSGEMLGENLYTVGGAPVASLRIERVDAAGVSGIVDLHRPVSAADCTVCVFVDNEFTCSAVCDSTENEKVLRFSIALPAHLFDARAHVFEAHMAGATVRSVPFVDILYAVQTPWEYIRTSSQHPGYASLSKIAAFRYESLRSSLSQAAGNAAAIANLQTAHDLVVEGHENRKSFPPLVLPDTASVTVSIVVPVHNKFELTYHCIASNILAANQTSWELIVVDDSSTDQTLELGELVENVVVIKNQENLGFLHSCNRGAQAARGEYIVFLNNDTEVTSFWLDEMLDVFARFSAVGAVGSKLIYPDGTLQDAGGIVWNNALPWNVGHGQNADDPAFNYTREVDYLTGASLMVSRASWQQVDGFSTEYAPAYYEDTDLAFKLREAGLRTFYCSRSTVVHFEGQSNGRDTGSGIKHYQEVNAARFTRRWIDSVADNGEEGVDLHLNKDRNREFRVLMLDHAFPCVGQDAGSYAAVQEMKLMMELGAKITFVPHNFTHLGKHTDELERMGVECIYAPFYTSVKVFLQHRGKEFDAIYITRYHIAGYVLPVVREYTDAKVIFNNADLHFLREMRAALNAGETDMSGPLATREQELAIMQQVDAILSYNETEHEIIASHTMRTDNIFKCPWVLEDHRNERDFQAREGIAFLGGFGHPPNREALEYFVESVVPLLRESGQTIPLRIYGSNFPDELQHIAAPDIEVIGFAESLDDVFNPCRVFIAPLLSGAGIKGKVLDSLSYGVPTVLSPVAAESTGLVHGVSTLVANTPQQWVDHILNLHNDENHWQQVREAASTLLDSEYSHSTGVERMQRVFRYIGLESVAPGHLPSTRYFALDAAA